MKAMEPRFHLEGAIIGWLGDCPINTRVVNPSDGWRDPQSLTAYTPCLRPERIRGAVGSDKEKTTALSQLLPCKDLIPFSKFHPSTHSSATMYGVLLGYVLFIIVCAAVAVAICWGVHYLFYRSDFASPLPMRAPQLSYMRDVRQRELQQLVASSDGNTEGDEKNFHDEFDDECTYHGS
jgi:hypothetical protein